MFEIGNTLRDARRRQGLDIADCERDTKIRAKYLMALEEERFEALPEPAYVRGMLRTYAEHLGVDPAPVVGEYGHRTRGSEPEAPDTVHAAPARPRRVPAGSPRRRRRGDPRLLWLGVGSIATAGVLVWIGASSGGPERVAPLEPLATTVAERAAAPPPAVSTPVAPARPRPPAAASRSVLRLMGQGGGSWLQVRSGGAQGKVLYEGTLAPGKSLRFPVGGGLWMRVGWGPGVRAALGATPAALPAGTADVTVTTRGIRV